MVIDYHQRKAVTKNRPKKQPVSLLIPVVAVAMVVSFAAGLGTGWFLYKAKHPVPLAGPVQEGSAPAADQQKAAAAAVSGQEQPLTFYETLSKGNSNALIGSGLNPKKPAEPQPAKPAASPPAPTAATNTPATQPQQAKPAIAASDHSAPPAASQLHTPPRDTAKEQPKPVPSEPTNETKKISVKSGSFTVQLASYKDRKEAEAMLVRTAEKGLPGYIVEARTQDKGILYRVRVGRKLDQHAANALAAKAGKGAIVIPE